MSSQVDSGRNMCLTTNGIRILISEEICSRRLHDKAKPIRLSGLTPLNILTRISVGKRKRLLETYGIAFKS